MDVRSEVIAQFEQVAEEQSKHLAPLTDDLPLYHSGLDAPSLALLVVRLEIALGLDPFSSDEGAEFPVTFGDFVGVYQHAAH